MSFRGDDLKKRTKRFALDVIRSFRTLPATDEARIIGRQLLRAGTGAGANYRASCRARSRREFVAKLGVALEEIDEAAFWIEVVVEGEIASGDEWVRLHDEANQLSAIIAQSRLTALMRTKRNLDLRT